MAQVVLLCMSMSLLFQDFQTEMDKLRKGLTDLNALVKDVILPLKAQLEEAKAANKQRTRDETPEMYNEYETQLYCYFPINIYTPAMNWLLKRPIVRRFLQYETIRTVYRNHPLFKPDAEFVFGKFLDYLMTRRLQSHWCKSTGSGRSQDYGRAPMAGIVVDIAEKELVDVGKRRVPGSKDVSEFVKDKCNSARRHQVLGAQYVKDSKSVQEMAFRIYSERVDFISKHEVRKYMLNSDKLFAINVAIFQWLFKDNKKKWSYDHELNKTRKLEISNGYKEDPTFDGSQPVPNDLELSFFPEMDVGQPLHDMAEAEALEAELIRSGLSKPVFPPNVWVVSALPLAKLACC